MSAAFSAERACARSASALAPFTFSTQRESIPSPCAAHAARLCCGSASSTMTLRPMAANSPARFPTIVDFPTPPFRPATAMIAIENTLVRNHDYLLSPAQMGQEILESVRDMEVGDSAKLPPVARILAYTILPDRKSTRLNSSHLGISYAV